MSNNQWVQPTPLRHDGTNLLPFPVNALPPIIGDMAQAIATTTSTDVAMAGTSILSAVSYCFSGVYRMSADKVEMLTIKESAALVSGLSEHTVRQLVKQGKVKSVRTGEGRNGKILVNKADLIAYFNGKGV